MQGHPEGMHEALDIGILDNGKTNTLQTSIEKYSHILS
jgi:hypothetical protein